MGKKTKKAKKCKRCKKKMQKWEKAKKIFQNLYIYIYRDLFLLIFYYWQVTNCFMMLPPIFRLFNNKVILIWIQTHIDSASLPTWNYLLGLGISNTFSLCLQAPNISCLLLRVDSWGLVIMMNFSRVQRLHTPEMGLKGWALPNIFHFKL